MMEILQFIIVWLFIGFILFCVSCKDVKNIRQLLLVTLCCVLWPVVIGLIIVISIAALLFGLFIKNPYDFFKWVKTLKW